MRDELLALLEDGPHSALELATWLEQPRLAVSQALGMMAAEALVKTIGTAKRWALVSYRPRLGRLPKPSVPVVEVDAEDGLRTLDEATTVALLTQHGPQTVINLATLLNVNQWTLRDRLAWWRVSGTIALTRYGRQPAIVSLPGEEPPAPPRAFVARPPRQPRAERPRPPARLRARPSADEPWPEVVTSPSAPAPEESGPVRVIDGQEYEVVFDGTGHLTQWPDGESRGGSSLSGAIYGVKR